MIEGVKKLTPRGNLLSRRRHANNDALAPALMARLERGAHDADVAGAVERVVAPTVRHLNQHVDHALALGQLGRVDKVGRAKFPRPRLLGRVDVHHNDPTRSLGDAALHHAQADAARAEDGHVAALLHLGRDARRAVARRDAAAEQAGPVHGRVLLHRHDRDVGHHRVLAESRGAHEVQDVLAAGAEARGPVGHDAAALRRADLAAQVGLARLAELALAAFGGTFGVGLVGGCSYMGGGGGRDGKGNALESNDMVARLDVGHTLADRLDDAGTFVAEDHGERTLRVLAGEGVSI
jgi:hypothetical protein